jgi:acyl-CoA thioesterase
MNKALAELVAEEMEKNDRVLALLGIKIVRVSAGQAELSMNVKSEMLNGFSIAHGGITFTLADTAFAYACNSHNRLTVARRCEIKFRKMVHVGDSLTAVAIERSLHGKAGIYDVKVTNQDKEEVATFIGESHTLDQEVSPELGVLG